MRNILRDIVADEGVAIFRNPASLREKLIAKGYPQKDAISIELMLIACPSIAAVITQREVSRSEANMIISTAVRTTNLSPIIVRRLLNELLCAAGNKLSWKPYFLLENPDSKSFIGTVETDGEEDLVRLAVETLAKGKTDKYDMALNDLNRLSEEGNGYASYRLGMYFYKRNEADHKELTYFTRAANQGYGPAYGALANCELKQKCNHRSLKKAAKYFESPMALAGTDGRRWNRISTELINYRENNKRKAAATIGAIIASIALTIAVAFFSPSSRLWITILTGVLELLCLGWSIFAKVFDPYFSHRNMYVVLMACWILNVLIIA